MLKVLRWRIGLEFWHLIAVLLQTPLAPLLARYNEPVAYFAFGANLDPKVLGRRKMRTQWERELLLRDHELVFNQPGFFEGFGFASAEPAAGRILYGKVYGLSRVDAIRMDYFELAPIIHAHNRISAEQDDLAFFFYRSTRPQSGLKPTGEYLDKILYSANRSAIIPADYLAKLQATPTLQEFVPRRNPQLVVRDYDRWSFLPWEMARKYDLLAIRLLRISFRISIFDRLIQS